MAAVTRRTLFRGAMAAAGLAVGVGPAALLGGCGGTSPARGAGALNLTLLGQAVGSPAADLTPLASALADAYNAAGGVAARVRPQAAEPSLAAYMESLLLGAPPVPADLMLTPPAVRNLLSAPSMMVSLDAALERTGLAGGIYDMVLQYCAPGGRQRMIPIFRDPLVVFYNVDAFSGAGVDPPAPTWTSDRLLWLCGQLLARPRGPVAPLANAVNTFDIEVFTAFVAGYGGRMLSPNANAHVPGFLPRFAEPQAIEGIDALLRLHPYEPPRPEAPPLALFARGDAAMCFGHHSDVRFLQAQIADLFAWGVAPLPRFPQRAAQPVRAEGIAAITRDPANREAAVAVALFAATADGQLAAARTGLGVPASKALASSGLWRQGAPHLDNDVFVANAQADIVLEPALYYIQPELEEALRAALAGAPVATIFGEASTAVELTLQTWPNA